MKNQFSLNIKTPCHENFDRFSQTPGGGFCGSCEKEVVDFTKMTTQDIVHYFNNQKTKNTCGRFNSTQLNRFKANRQQRRKLSLISGIGLSILSFFSITTTQAQDTKKETGSRDNTSEIEASKSEKNIIVKGTVTDESLALPAVNIILEGSAIGTQTDFDGNFEFPEKLKKGDVLIFSYFGMESQKVVITNEDSASKVELKINMKMDSYILMGKVAVKEVYTSKRSK